MLKPVDAAQARRALKQKGFQELGKRDHEMYILYVDGKKTDFLVKISHGSREIRKDEISNNARSVGIKSDDLYRILCCEHNAEKTVRLFLEANPISPAST